MASSRARFRTFAILAILALAAAAVAIQLSASGQTLRLGGAGIAALQKGDAKSSEQDLTGNGGEADPSVATLAEEQAINRAIPLDQIPLSATQAAGQSFDNLDQETDQNNQRRGTWSLLGPTRAFQPGVLSFTGADNVTSGRITSLAIGPRCTPRSCRLWVGAAGGGIWRTNNALSDNPTWRSVSNGLSTNAIGTIVVDPTDPSGRTLYVGTGEPNASADSEAGLGLFKSTNGGDSWELVSGSFAVSKSRAISSVVIDPHNAKVIYIGTTRAVRGVSSVAGGSVSVDPNGQPAFGLYQTTDGGATWAMIWDGAGTARGVNHVELNPTNPNIIYASAFQQGIYRRSALDGGTFKQIFGTADAINNAARTEFAVTTTKLGHTRIYAGDGGSGPLTTAFWRTDNADVPAAALVSGGSNIGWTRLTSANGTAGYATSNYCTGQCWYDNYVVTPPGEPDTVVVLGSYQYGEIGGRSNTRAILRSKTAGNPDLTGPRPGRTFTDLSWDATSATTPNSVHPDQHAFAFAPGNPNIWFEGSDGGIIRSSGTYTDISPQCDGRKPGGVPLSANSLRTCHWLLSEVPTKLTFLNKGLPTLQLQSLSLNPAKPNGVIMGGTQDNGTWLFTGSRSNWNQTIYGDGGQSGFDVANPAIRFNTFFGPATDENFRSGDPTKWVVTSGPLFKDKEAAAFYIPIIADPSVGGTQFAGLQHVFRTKDNGGNQAYLEANCPEFTASASDPNCGDWVALGNDLTGSAYGTRPGSFIVALARGADHSTLWAATRVGRVFVSHNADEADPTKVVFTRIDNLAPGSPNRFVSGITVDPTNSNHAWISYSGYSTTTPITPGHVFDVTFTPASDEDAASTTYRNLNVEGLNGDLPITGIVRDNASGQLFVSTDFGVLTWSRENDPAWDVAGSGLPKVEVAGLTYSQKTHTLYAATHGRGAWVMKIESQSDNGGHGN